MPRLDFWFDFASPYSWLAAMRAEALADNAGVRLNWRPFLLGPIFSAQGFETSPFKIFPIKGAYMWRDVERLAFARGLAFTRPENFPQDGLRAARLALLFSDEKRPKFCRAVFSAQFSRDQNIADPEILGQILADLGEEPQKFLAEAASERIKQKLRAETEAAAAAQIFGAPSFSARDGELFWGDDRFEQALDWAVKLEDG